MAVLEAVRPRARADLRQMRMLFDGSWVDSLSGVTLTVENPAKRKLIATTPRGDAADLNGAVEAAARAFRAWSKLAPRDRGRLLRRIGDKMKAETEEIAGTIVLESGNALRTQARGEARLAARHLPLFRRPRRGAEGRNDPFVGYERSGIGREFSLQAMLDSFTQRKNVTLNLHTPRQ